MQKSSRRPCVAPPVDLVALEVHRRAVVALVPNLNAGRLGEVVETFAGRALGQAGADRVHVEAFSDETNAT
jgi:hypothetical protein